MSAKFVPVGRGNKSLDCFRIYEAAACGAIPIVVGPALEMTNTFGKPLPPMLWAATWAEAKDEVDRLLRNDQQLMLQQRSVVDWWETSLTKLRGVLSGSQRELAT